MEGNHCYLVSQEDWAQLDQIRNESTIFYNKVYNGGVNKPPWCEDDDGNAKLCFPIFSVTNDTTRVIFIDGTNVDVDIILACGSVSACANGRLQVDTINGEEWVRNFVVYKPTTFGAETFPAIVKYEPPPNDRFIFDKDTVRAAVEKLEKVSTLANVEEMRRMASANIIVPGPTIRAFVRWLRFMQLHMHGTILTRVLTPAGQSNNHRRPAELTIPSRLLEHAMRIYTIINMGSSEGNSFNFCYCLEKSFEHMRTATKELEFLAPVFTSSSIEDRGGLLGPGDYEFSQKAAHYSRIIEHIGGGGGGMNRGKTHKEEEEEDEEGKSMGKCTPSHSESASSASPVLPPSDSRPSLTGGASSSSSSTKTPSTALMKKLFHGSPDAKDTVDDWDNVINCSGDSKGAGETGCSAMAMASGSECTKGKLHSENWAIHEWLYHSLPTRMLFHPQLQSQSPLPHQSP